MQRVVGQTHRPRLGVAQASCQMQKAFTAMRQACRAGIVQKAPGRGQQRFARHRLKPLPPALQPVLAIEHERCQHRREAFGEGKSLGAVVVCKHGLHARIVELRQSTPQAPAQHLALPHAGGRCGQVELLQRQRIKPWARQGELEVGHDALRPAPRRQCLAKPGAQARVTHQHGLRREQPARRQVGEQGFQGVEQGFQPAGPEQPEAAVRIDGPFVAHGGFGSGQVGQRQPFRPASHPMRHQRAVARARLACWASRPKSVWASASMASPVSARSA